VHFCDLQKKILLLNVVSNADGHFDKHLNLNFDFLPLICFLTESNF